MMTPFVVGLTGGIGSGKSTVTQFFADLGVLSIDVDLISHQLTSAGGMAMARIREAFGEKVIAPDGSLNRLAMRELAFDNAVTRQKLQDILHPEIFKEVVSAIRNPARETPYIVVSVPLLFEVAGYQDMVDRILVVDCEEEEQRQRVAARSGLSSGEVQKIMDTQLPRTVRCQGADDIITNHGGLSDLERDVGTLHQAYLKMAVTSVASRNKKHKNTPLKANL